MIDLIQGLIGMLIPSIFVTLSHKNSQSVEASMNVLETA